MAVGDLERPTEAAAAAKAAGPSAPSAAPSAEPDEGRMGARPGEGLPADAPASAASEARVMRHELLLEALQNAEYHAAREGLLMSVNRVFTFVSVITGTTAFAAISARAGDGWHTWIALGPVVASGLSLVLNLTARSHQHAVLRGRYQAIWARLESCSADELGKCRDEMRALYPSEPPPYHAMLALAHNAAIDRLYPEDKARKYRLVVPWRDRLAGRFLRLGGSAYSPPTAS